MSEKEILAAIKELSGNMAKNTNELKNNIETSKNEIKQEMSEMLQSLNAQIKNANEKIEKLENIVESQNSKIESLEKQLKLNNIILYGLVEAQNEENLAEDVEKFFKDNLKIEIKKEDINYVRRIGKKESQKPRPIVVSFISQYTKQVVMKKKHSLKDTDYFIKNDMTKSQRQSRTELFKKVESLKKAGNQNVEIKHGKIYVDNEIFKEQDIQSDNVENRKRFRSRESRPSEKVAKPRKTSVESNPSTSKTRTRNNSNPSRKVEVTNSTKK